MQKLFRLTALFAAAMLVVWVVGCGDDDDDDDDDTAPPVASVTNLTPADGGDVFLNGTIMVEFDNAVASCTIGGGTATLDASEKNAEITVAAAGLALGDGQSVTITWVNKDDSTGSKSVTYNVNAEDTDAPTLDATKIDGSAVSDGETDVSVASAEIILEFSEALDDGNSTVTLTLDGNNVGWVPTFDGVTVTLEPAVEGTELSHEKEYIVEIDVKDAAGNPCDDTEFTFNTETKE